MAFRFGFGSHDEDEVDGAEALNNGDRKDAASAAAKSTSVPTASHTLRELLSALPERISYSTVRVESPIGRIINLPRRDMYDVRAQLLQEGSENDEIIDQIDKADIRSGVYEGGFKTWECSLDLASLLLDRGPRKDIDELHRCDNIIELGAGTALPTLVLFQHALRSAIPMTFTLADYNLAVLRLVTLPNLILTWAAASSGDDKDGLMRQGEHGNDDDTSDLELTPDVINRFIADMQSNDITLNFISGPWSPDLANFIPQSGVEMGTVILASETIYSPESTEAFVDLTCALLQRVKMSKAMVAAKRMYFGVGGSVDGLKAACRDKGAVAYEIENHGVPGMDAGVGRALIEIQMY